MTLGEATRVYQAELEHLRRAESALDNYELDERPDDAYIAGAKEDLKRAKDAMNAEFARVEAEKVQTEWLGL